ncbi:BatD family protein [Thermochromatium tepidum]|uniref:Protein BatD n=1 Tax=Thermochromatium tepidum ATCC 43061 TaxID=316276 RepID=A0A6I6E091_THETI|nr:BatD family protein [Thermochromatium tepidum]QGU32355.1 hypothetical protein E6P07_04730 [Thermochromatium tepidum ATCC 43061]
MVIPTETSRRMVLPAVAALIAASGPIAAQPYAGQPYPGPSRPPYYAPFYNGQPYYGQPPLPTPTQPQPPAWPTPDQPPLPSRSPAPAQPQPPQTQPWPVQPSPQSAPPPLSSQPGTSQYRPIPPSHAQGVPPSYPPLSSTPGHWPAQSPQGYPSGYAPGSAQPTAARAPTLEWSLEFADPYLQQPTLLQLAVVSRDNPSSINLELPNTSDALIKTLKGPSTETRSHQGQQEILNRFVLTVVPLRTGDLELPPLKVTVILAGLGFSQRYELSTERPIRLQVRPPMTSVRPWLPLKSLTLKSSLDREGPLEPGQPVTLALEIAAVGGIAVQLPSLENQLTGPNLRVYREQTLTTTELSPDGRELLATRTEYYTLVPQTGGRITLPEMSLAWWNVDLGQREVARLPLKTLDVRGGGPFGLSAATLAASPWARLWIPITGILLLIGGYWLGVFYRGRVLDLGRDLLRLTGRGLSAGYRLTATWIGPRLRPLAPSTLFTRGRERLWRALPSGWHVIARVRHANHAVRPDDWYPRFAAAQHGVDVLRGTGNQPGVIAYIQAHRPGVDPVQLARLLSQLDAAVYGGAPLDFSRWKRAFLRQVRLGPGVGRSASGRIRWAGLPVLNPRPA